MSQWVTTSESQRVSSGCSDSGEGEAPAEPRLAGRLALPSAGRSDARNPTNIRSLKSKFALREAFTLVEVLAALVLIAIVLPVIMRGVSMATEAAAAARQRTQATALVSLKLNELLGTQQWEYGSLSGDFGTEFPGYQWSAQLQNWLVSGVQELDVHVTWTTGGRQQTSTLSTLVYNDAPVGPESPSASTGQSSGTGSSSSSGGTR